MNGQTVTYPMPTTDAAAGSTDGRACTVPFEHRHTITIGDTNIYQNAYFLTLVGIQGTVRELFVRNAVEDAMQTLQDGLKLLTKSVSCTYDKEFLVFETVLVKLTFRDIRRATCRLVFRYYEASTGELRATGEQRIAFVGKDGRPCRIPDNFMQAAIRHADLPTPADA